jgi:mRNA-degrading endonuclease RelE of RelBE toxin-antitoxin system
MTFKVLIHPKVFEKVSVDRRDQIKEALRELKDPLPGGNKKEVKGSHKRSIGFVQVIFAFYTKLILNEARFLFLI